MTVECSICGKEMQDYPFTTVTTCIKCTLDTQFESYGTFKSITREDHERELQLDNEKIGVGIV